MTIKYWFTFISDKILFPKFCVGCGQVDTYLCSNCAQAISQKELICPTCKKVSFGGATHLICRRRYSLDGLWSMGAYEGILQESIHKLKYRFVTELAEILAQITIEYWAKNQPMFLEQIKKDRGENWLIVPVPLHPQRQNWRGFNQTELIGHILSESIGLGCYNAIKRTRITKPQVQLKADFRQKNIKASFALKKDAVVKDKNILLLDDVWTTGSTLKECCFVLKKGGAKKVWAITLAR